MTGNVVVMRRRSRLLPTATLPLPILLLVLSVIAGVQCENLTPPYFNLAEGKEIIASATCGVNTTGPELYCKLVGANSDQNEDINLIQGQVCDYCDPTNPEKNHPPEHAVDGMETWWQSPPLSRNMKYNLVNLTINLEQEFHVAYVYVRMGNSPRPGLWALEKSKDYGKTWSPWQYFSDSESDCLTYFGVDAHTPITRDDSVICTTEYSKIVPLEGGEIPISILNNRPSAKHYFNSTLLQEWTRATNVRFRFLRTKNLLGHLMSVARQDPTVTRRYFYSIKDISIGGRCMCNGHADTCDIQDPSQPKKLVCRCQHNTHGPQCASCLPGFQQKKWQQSTTFKKFTCEPCNCFGHSNECIYDPVVDEEHRSLDIHGNYEGGGVCQNCTHNTEGTNCNRCKSRFFRPRGKPLNATDVCQPCNCDLSYSTGNCADSTGQCECRPEYTPPNCDSCSYGYFGYPNCRPCECKFAGTQGYHCAAIDGQCPCKPNYAGHYCDLCAERYYNYPDCLACNCNRIGALDDLCDVVSGNCTCKNNFGGRACDTCEDGYFNYPTCEYCKCDARGTEPSVCDKTTGSCLCRDGYGGARCDQCASGYYGFPNCRPCNCSPVGSSSVGCDAAGKCSCLNNFAGRACDQCSPGYFRYPDCDACDCDTHGSIGISCDSDGECQCHPNFAGLRCSSCRQGFYNFPRCEGCNCDPAGVVESFKGCGSLPAGELCQCKERVQGRICNECKPLYWNLQAANPRGCEDCACNVPGVIGSIAECDPRSGQCICKPGVTGRSCERCVDGTYDLSESNLFGCRDCGCDIGGSIGNVCDKTTGQCACQPRVTGLTCRQPLKAHYFPTLHQFQYEVEDGRTPAGKPVRYGFIERYFPGYSWKGYAAFDSLQDEIIQRVDIRQPSVYRMVLRYVNRNDEPVVGQIVVTPDSPSELPQAFKVVFRPTVEPAFVTVAGDKSHGPHGSTSSGSSSSGAGGGLPSPFVMNPGWWSVSVKTEKSLFLDYFVLLPSEYYEATLLTQDVNAPCEIGHRGLCRHYGYPSLRRFDRVRGADGFVDYGDTRGPLVEYLVDGAALAEYGESELPLINDAQREIHFELILRRPGPRVLVVTYVTPAEAETSTTLTIDAGDYGEGRATLYPCRYTSVCRQVVTDRRGEIAVFDFDVDQAILVLRAEADSNVAVDSIVAVPYDDWSLDYIEPKSVCVRKDGKCVQGMFPGTADAKKVEFEQDNQVVDVEERRPTGIYDNATKLVHLRRERPTVDVTTRVPQPGEYIIIVQYYQPDHPGFELDVVAQNGKSYPSKLTVDHCPSNSGCRAVVRQIADGNERFQLEDEDFVLSFGNPGADTDIWLDYILVIPAEQYTDRFLKKIQFDQTKEFIKRCGNNNFHSNVTDKGFCRDSVFSLTTHYNSGALPCHCVAAGSKSFECDQFGGQCPCRENIVGRRCEICRTGYYGYPNCKPCDCPSEALCEPDTGACICPPRVIGEHCDQCEAGTYGFHPIVGCEECDCSPAGVLDGNVQCDLLDGTCACKTNVVGRKCDKCRAGYSQFPHCLRCDCDVRGTTEDVCDQYTAECHCKPNVQGSACDVCKDGTFNIQADNEQGCSKCFCFGKTTRCASASLYRTHTTNMRDWEVVLLEEKSLDNVTVLWTIDGDDQDDVDDPRSAIVRLSEPETFQKMVYLSAPDDYLGKKLTSYGGRLNYTIRYSIGQFGKAVQGADVILHGAGSYLLYYCDEQPPSFTDFKASLRLVESNLLTSTNLPVTREQLLTVLEDLRGIYVRATYWNASIEATLSDVTLDEATETYSHSSVLASSVEQCQCPTNYRGLSCEECAPGYYRVQSGRAGGSCVKCQCNGHADTCDVDTGICHDCKHGTTGDHCELCQAGYYGNATVGTPGDCLICACPLPINSNNFATGCEVSPEGDKINCDCKEGYWGDRCESCAAGYFGSPESEGDYCRPCECSGNIDTNEIGSCDSVTGECRHCLNNTYGEACNICAPGFFGDAVERKDCRSCFCDKCGMDKCDSRDGVCHCRRNVVGEKCDRCDDNHYGFHRCDGCDACDCGVASESSQCDDETGQCRCKPGVTGRRCDRCIAGFWNYGPDGCVSCGCNTGYSLGASCNTTTGQCSCLPGVIGEKCDHCPYRWVLKEGDGCYECDSCVHDLLDVTDDLANLLAPITREFTTVAESYFTNQRLKFVNDTAAELEPSVRLLDPTRVDFRPLQQRIEALDAETARQKRGVAYTDDDSIKWRAGAERTLRDMNELEDEVAREIARVTDIIDDVRALAFGIESGTGSKVDSALREAQETLKKIQETTFTNFRDAATDQWNNANIIVTEMIAYNVPATKLGALADGLVERVGNFSAKVDDLFQLADRAREIARTAEQLVSENKRAMESGNLDQVRNYTAEARDDVDAGRKLNEQAKEHLLEAALKIDELRRSVLDSEVEKLRTRKEDNDDELLNVEDIVTRALDHAKQLYEQSLKLDDELTDTRNTSAVRAVSAYREVDETIGAARADAQEAVQAANNATNVSRGIGQRTRAARDTSSELLRTARDARAATEGQLVEDLALAVADAKVVDAANKKSDEALEYIDRMLKNLKAPESELIDKSTREAREIDDLVKEAQENMRGIVDEIPRDLEETRKLTRETTQAMRNASQANKQLDPLQRVVPNITELLDRLSATKKTIDATGAKLLDKIEKLKSKVANAREMADKFQTPLTFYRNTTLQLRNPENLPLLATSTKLSVYLSTNKTNGFLLYLGNENTNSPRAKTRDFMALMIESGYPVLIVDLGSGPEKVIGKHFVSDGAWRQIIVDRTGKNVKLIVREEPKEGKEKEYVTEHALPGTFAIFNLDRDQSKLFVGGYPTSFQIQDAVTSSSFEGEMQDLVVGDRPVSFWNFVRGENNRDRALERDRLVDLATTTGYRFDRDGYVVMSLRNSKIRWEDNKFWITLKFKTFAEDGLIYLTTRGRHFMSLEMRDGHVVYRFDLGAGEALLRSEGRFNDGEEHTVEARRLDNVGRLTIDKTFTVNAAGPDTAGTYRAADPFYIGGYPLDSHHTAGVTNVRFDGCIDHVVIQGTEIDMSKNVHALGVTPGCPARFASLVSFEESTPGYVRWINVTAAGTLQVNLKFKTQATNGLIFYATDPEQQVNSMLSLVDGRLVLRSQGEEVATSPSAGIKFNDNEWHVVTATHSESALRLDIDDTETYDGEAMPPALSIAEGSLYIGGVPNALGSGTGNEATTPFVGCIGDTTLNGAIINFASTKERPNAFLGKCTGVEQSPMQPPIVRPIPGNWPPPLVTDDYETTPPSPRINVVDVDDGEDVDENANTIGGNVPIEGRPKPQQPPRVTTVAATTEAEEVPEEPVTSITTTTPAAPVTVDQCQLPYHPAADPNTENAWRFGAVRNSRFEYRSLEGRYKDDYDFQIDVQTLADDGIVFYGSDLGRQDLIAVWLQDRRVHYRFDCGSGPATLTSLREISDNKWHTIVFKRQGNLGELIVGDDPPVTGYSQGHTKAINVNPPFYVGGVPREIAESVFENIGMNKSFHGCVANFMTNGQHVGEPAKQAGVIPCSKHVEPGLFFHPGDGTNMYKAVDRFTVGRNIDIELEIKPRSNSGHLLSIHGRRDFLLLEMVNGTIRFLVKASKGPFETSFVPTAPNSLCDGNWHNIRVMRKKNALQLFVGHAAAPPAIGAQNSVGVLTKHPVYIGGHPLLAKKLRGSTSHAQYVGCMRNLRINGKPKEWDPERAYGRVLTGVCPTI